MKLCSKQSSIKLNFSSKLLIYFYEQHQESRKLTVEKHFFHQVDSLIEKSWGTLIA